MESPLTRKSEDSALLKVDFASISHKGKFVGRGPIAKIVHSRWREAVAGGASCVLGPNLKACLCLLTLGLSKEISFDSKRYLGQSIIPCFHLLSTELAKGEKCRKGSLLRTTDTVSEVTTANNRVSAGSKSGRGAEDKKRGWCRACGPQDTRYPRPGPASSINQISACGRRHPRSVHPSGDATRDGRARVVRGRPFRLFPSLSLPYCTVSRDDCVFPLQVLRWPGCSPAGRLEASRSVHCPAILMSVLIKQCDLLSLHAGVVFKQIQVWDGSG